jgi:hypothetical protein
MRLTVYELSATSLALDSCHACMTRTGLALSTHTAAQKAAIEQKMSEYKGLKISSSNRPQAPIESQVYGNIAWVRSCCAACAEHVGDTM